jgi:ABC-type phosphate transport system substrate-binding protein
MMAHRRVALRLSGFFILLVIVGAPLIAAAPAGAVGSPIAGGGSGFAALELDQWRADTARAPYNLKVNYVAQGSTFGRQQFASNTLDFGASDIPFPPIEAPGLPGSARCGGRVGQDCFVYVPVSAGGLALMYNLVDDSGQRVNNLQLTRRAACGIFTDAITKWNDPQIVATNPQLAGFDRNILPVLRGDGAGESYVFSQFCQVVAPDLWANFVNLLKDDPNSGLDFKQGLPVSNWPQGWGHSSTALYADGVANVVADPVTGQNSITLVAAGYAKVRNNWPVASLQNAVGQYTQPDEDNVTVALGYATPNPDPAAVGTFILHYDGPDPRAYFPSTYSYILAQTTGFDPGKGAALGLFLCYAVSKGQVIAPLLRYARLSAPLVAIAINAISKIPGAPPSNQCFLQGAPPPPQQPTVAGGPGAVATGPSGARAGTATGAGGTTATGPGGASGSATNCTTTSSTTTTAAGKASTTTTAPKAAATTTTTTSKSPSTTAASTTTTTAPCSANGTDANGTRAGINGTGVESVDLQGQLAAAQNQKQNDGGGLSDLGAIALGAGLCAVGTTVGRMRRGPS